MRGKKTDIETKAKITELRVTKGMLGSDIAEELGINERTVQRVIENDVSEVVGDSKIIQNIIKDAIDASRIMGEITLNMAKDIRKRQIQVDEGAEGFRPSTDEIRTLNTTVSEGFKRSQLLSGKATNILEVKQFDHLDNIIDNLV